MLAIEKSWGNFPHEHPAAIGVRNYVNPCPSSSNRMDVPWHSGCKRSTTFPMRAKLIKDCGLAATLFVASVSWSAAQSAPAKPAPTPPAKSAAADPAKVAADNLQKAKEQLAVRSDQYLADRQKLIDQYKSATEEQKKTLLAKMEEQRQSMLEASREIAKQARDDARKQRQNGVPPGRK